MNAIIVNFYTHRQITPVMACARRDHILSTCECGCDANPLSDPDTYCSARQFRASRDLDEIWSDLNEVHMLGVRDEPHRSALIEEYRTILEAAWSRYL